MLSYAEFKTTVTNKILENFIQYKELNKDLEEDKMYYIYAIDDKIKYECEIDESNNAEDVIDFETNYKSIANKILDEKEIVSGYHIVKNRPVNASFFLNHIYFKTGDINNFNPGLSTHWSISVNDIVNTTKKETIIIFQPNFSYYIEGGICNVRYGTFSQDIVIQMILVPDVPEEYGGSRSFVPYKKFQPYNIAYCTSLNLIAPPAYIKYYEGMPELNKLQIKITHEAVDQAETELALRIYK